MLRKHLLVPSEEMGRSVHLWCYGHYGAPVLVFPSASGMAHEWDSHGMVEAVGDFIEQGRLKLYCTESNVAEAWTRRETDPAWRIGRHQMYERYVVNELAPFIRRDCASDDVPIAVSGTSLGALYSANFVLKFPEIFRYALCMSGRYDVSWLTDGFHSESIYFNNPMAYVPGLDGDVLDRLRKVAHLTLVCGQGKWEDGNIEDTRDFAAILEAKGISNSCDLWGRDVTHAWSWWRRQAHHHLDSYLPPPPQ